MRVLGAILLVAVAFASSAQRADAQGQDVRQHGIACLNRDESRSPAEVVAGCTALIGAGVLDTHDLSVAYSYRADAHFDAGERALSIADYDQAIRQNPQNLSAYINRGAVRYDGGELTEALADFEQAIQLDPRNSVAIFNRGNVRQAFGNYDQAMEDYNQSIALNPLDPAAYFNRAVAYAERGAADEALADYSEAVRINPQHWEAYVNRGAIHMRGGADRAAIADFTAAIDINPTLAFVYSNRGNSYVALGEFASALSDFDRALRLQPEEPGFLQGRCLARAVWGQALDAALADCEAAFRADHTFLASRAFVRLRRGELVPALTDYDVAIRQAPDNGFALYGRGVARIMIGQESSGRDDIARANQVAPSARRLYVAARLGPE
jgi:tetratricopeptide (TPR) repeat protein